MAHFFKTLTQFLLLVGGALALANCRTTQHLAVEKGERLLVKNDISIAAPKGFGGKPELQYSLSALYKQQPNSRFLFLFRWRLWLHYQCKDRKTKLAGWINKRVAEQPAIYSEELTQRTAKNFENYVRQRGYFDARCEYDAAFGKYKAQVRYNIDMGALYLVDTLRFTSLDSNVQRVLDQTAGRTHIGPGQPLDGEKFEAEKLRITAEMKNRGYAYFLPNYVDVTGDSVGKKANVTLEVLLPGDSLQHQTYRVGKVAVFSSLVPDYSSIRRDTTIEGIYFASSDQEFTAKPQRLFDAISIRPGALYRQEEFDRTYQKLTALGIFRFISIKPVQDSLNADLLDVTIALAANKRFSIGGDADLRYSNSFISNQLLGTAVGVYAQNRNIFGGGEHLSLNLGGNVQFDLLTPERRFNSVEIKAQTDLTTPRFADYFGLWRGLNRAHIGEKKFVNDAFYKHLRQDGRARFSLSYNYLDLLDYYSYTLAHGSYGYDVQIGREAAWSFEHLGVDALRPDTSRQRWAELSENEFIRRSFGNQLFTGFLLRSANYNYAGTSNRFGEHWNFRFGGELSGTEQWLAYKLWTKAFGPEDAWKIGALEFAKYLRLDLDGTYTRDFNRNLTGAVRVGAGLAVPFGDSKAVPYVKQFFVGGPYSLRAWQIREIGPGGYYDANLQPDDAPFYQTGDFRFEFNGELRFPLYWWFKGAFFLDGGNVWTLKKDASRPGAELRWDSYKNIALGTGFGVRMDVEYFILRVDMGKKLRSPYTTAERPSPWHNPSSSAEKINWNIAVGLPF